MIRSNTRPRPLADWRCSPIAADVPAAVEAAAVAYLGAREAHRGALAAYLAGPHASWAEKCRRADALDAAADRLTDARLALEGALSGRRGYHPAGGALVGLVSTRHGLTLAVRPASLRLDPGRRRDAAEERP